MNINLMRCSFLALMLSASTWVSAQLLEPVELNGFDLSDVSVPQEDIFQGGPPREGIPAIDVPKFVGVDAADFLSDDDRVLGVEMDGVARAYPIRILNWHEIVNDKMPIMTAILMIVFGIVLPSVDVYSDYEFTLFSVLRVFYVDI